jgi:hypothetical protein
MYVIISVEEIYVQQGREFVPSVLKFEGLLILSFQEPSSVSSFGFCRIARLTIVWVWFQQFVFSSGFYPSSSYNLNFAEFASPRVRAAALICVFLGRISLNPSAVLVLIFPCLGSATCLVPHGVFCNPPTALLLGFSLRWISSYPSRGA